MATLVNFYIKNSEGVKSYYTMRLSDETNQYTQNVAVWNSQTQEQRSNKVPKEFIGNGTVDWTDGKVTLVDRTQKKENSTEKNENPVEDLDF